MLPWVQDRDGRCVHVRVTDPEQDAILKRLAPESKDDTCVPYRRSVAYMHAPQGEWADYWEKKIRGLNGKQVRILTTARRFDFEGGMDYGPEHGWALEVISVKIIERKGH